MTDEMKLLMALCDALGFDVEVIDESTQWVTEDNSEPPFATIMRSYKLTKKDDK